MTQRVRNLTAAFNDAPFSGSGGTSLYATAGTSVRYRNVRVLSGGGRRRRRKGYVKGSGGVHDLSAASVLKTARIDSATDPTDEFTTALPASLIPGSGTANVTFDVRRFALNVENESDNFRTVTVEVDSSGDIVAAILGTGTLLNLEVRAGGVVRIRFRYNSVLDGTVPTQFVASRTAGPTSPSDATVSYVSGQAVYEIDTPALSDASAYTYKITAEAGAVTSDILTGISVTADATGPSAPTSGVAEAW